MGKEIVEQEKTQNREDCFRSENTEACCGDCETMCFDPFADNIESLACKAFKVGVVTATVLGAVAFFTYKGVKRGRKTRAKRFTVKH